MFGKNEVTKPFRDPEGRLLVNELFYTIQGEGPDAGRPAIFLRLSKCNLRCHFCDTEFETGTPRTAQDVASSIKFIANNMNCKLLVITGGEPLLQNIAPIVHRTNLLGLDVSIETAGTTWWSMFDQLFEKPINKIIVSPKTPMIDRKILPYVRAWKYIVAEGSTADDDGLPIESTQIKGDAARVYRPTRHVAPIYVQPMDEQDPVRNQRNVEHAAQVCLRFGYRLSVQMHKLARVP
jgi:organic radical activating enzyme